MLLMISLRHIASSHLWSGNYGNNQKRGKTAESDSMTDGENYSECKIEKLNVPK